MPGTPPEQKLSVSSVSVFGPRQFQLARDLTQRLTVLPAVLAVVMYQLVASQNMLHVGSPVLHVPPSPELYVHDGSSSVSVQVPFKSVQFASQSVVSDVNPDTGSEYCSGTAGHPQHGPLVGTPPPQH